MDSIDENKSLDHVTGNNNASPDNASETNDEKTSLVNEDLSLDDVFINLTLISKIEIGNKLIKNGKYVNIDNSYFSFLSRWLYGSNRKETIYFITHILNKAFEYCSELVTINNVESAQHSLRLNSDLKNSINGLTNLKLTYSYDKLVQSEIDVMIDNIRSKLDLYFKNVNYSPLNHSVSSSQLPSVEPLELSEPARVEPTRVETVRVDAQDKRENQKKEKKHYPVPVPVIYNS